MAGEIRSQGTEFWICNTATTVLKIGNITDIGEFGKQAGEIDTSNLDSAAKEYLAGLPDNGEITLTVNVDPKSAAHQFMNTNAGGAAVYDSLVGWSDGTTAPTATGGVITPPAAASRSSSKFKTVIKGYRYQVGGIDSVIKATITMRVTGAITETFKA